MTDQLQTPLLPCPFCGGKAVDRREIDDFPMIYCDGEGCFGPQTTAKSFDDALLQWNTRAPLSAQTGEPVAWRKIESAPKDGTPIELWHNTWNCPVSARYRRNGAFCWTEVTLTTQWPMEAFTHWRPASPPPQPDTALDHLQQRGRHYDIIQQAVADYDEWMLDDDYDAMTKLHGIMGQMRARLALSDAPDTAPLGDKQ